MTSPASGVSLAHRQHLMRNATDMVELPITLRAELAQPGIWLPFFKVAMPSRSLPSLEVQQRAATHPRFAVLTCANPVAW